MAKINKIFNNGEVLQATDLNQIVQAVNDTDVNAQSAHTTATEAKTAAQNAVQKSEELSRQINNSNIKGVVVTGEQVTGKQAEVVIKVNSAPRSAGSIMLSIDGVEKNVEVFEKSVYYFVDKEGNKGFEEHAEFDFSTTNVSGSISNIAQLSTATTWKNAVYMFKPMLYVGMSTEDFFDALYQVINGNEVFENWYSCKKGNAGIYLRRKNMGELSSASLISTDTGAELEILDTNRDVNYTRISENALNTADGIYEIRTGINLEGKTLDVGKDSQLIFSGGYIENGTLKFDGTANSIVSQDTKYLRDVRLTGYRAGFVHPIHSSVFDNLDSNLTWGNLSMFKGVDLDSDIEFNFSDKKLALNAGSFILNGHGYSVTIHVTDTTSSGSTIIQFTGKVRINDVSFYNINEHHYYQYSTIKVYGEETCELNNVKVRCNCYAGNTATRAVCSHKQLKEMIIKNCDLRANTFVIEGIPRRLLVENSRISHYTEVNYTWGLDVISAGVAGGRFMRFYNSTIYGGVELVDRIDEEGSDVLFANCMLDRISIGVRGHLGSNEAIVYKVAYKNCKTLGINPDGLFSKQKDGYGYMPTNVDTMVIEDSYIFLDMSDWAITGGVQFAVNNLTLRNNTIEFHASKKAGCSMSLTQQAATSATILTLSNNVMNIYEGVNKNSCFAINGSPTLIIEAPNRINRGINRKGDITGKVVGYITENYTDASLLGTWSNRPSGDWGGTLQINKVLSIFTGQRYFCTSLVHVTDANGKTESISNFNMFAVVEGTNLTWVDSLGRTVSP